MTDVELLPLPSPQVPFIDCDPSMTDIRRLVRWYEQGATEYARANVSRATAPLQAEVEALRAEVERLRTDRDSWEQQASDRVADWHAEHLRAERLAEVCERLARKWELQADEHGVRQFTGNDHRLFANELRAALAQEDRND